MGRFAKDELMAALEHYTRTVDRCSQTGDWAPFADLFTEDVTYVEHAYGVMHGREQVRRWIVDVMAPFPHMRFTHSWVAVDEDAGALVMEIMNILDHPTDPDAEFGFPNVSRLVYAGDNQWSSEEDVYNPVRDAPAAVGAWLQAGGTPQGPFLPMQHG